ncbi:MAG: hydroxymethylbilane synthase, partial [Spirochaetota bacterium]
MKIRIGTRGSALALWQADHVASLLGADRCGRVIIKTQGDKVQDLSFDKIEGKGFFTKEIEAALLNGEADIAVHSMKDLPVEDTPGLCIGAVLKRAGASDILLSRADFIYGTPAGLAPGSLVGTGSVRRSSQLAHADPSLRFGMLRGNVPTRIEKLRRGDFDAVVLAEAGLVRLGADLSGLFTRPVPFSLMLPAP